MRFLDGIVEIGVEGQVVIPVEPGSGTGLFAVALVRWHPVPRLRLDFAPKIGVELVDDEVGKLSLPLSLVGNFTSSVFAGVGLTASVDDFSDSSLGTSVLLGATLPAGDAPEVDLYVETFLLALENGVAEVVFRTTIAFFL